MSENQQETTSQAEQQAEKQEIQSKFEDKLGLNSEKTTQKSLIPEEFKKNLNNLQIVLNSGLINPLQGQNLLNHIIQEALKMNVQNTQEDLTTQISDKNTVFEEFAKTLTQLNADELSKISKIVEVVEASAIERYLQKVAHEQNLEKANLQAKQKLQANAQNTKSECKNFSPFTREQIGKMTSAEYLKNEPLIMEQLKKGLIK